MAGSLGFATFRARMEGWTRAMIRFRWPLVVLWLAVLAAGNFAGFALLPSRLNNEGTVPGTDSNRARAILIDDFKNRDVGNYLIVARVPNSGDSATKQRFLRYLERAAAAIPTGSAQPIQAAGPHVLYAPINSNLDIARAQKETKTVRRIVHQMPGAKVYVSGTAAQLAESGR